MQRGGNRFEPGRVHLSYRDNAEAVGSPDFVSAMHINKIENPRFSNQIKNLKNIGGIRSDPPKTIRRLIFILVESKNSLDKIQAVFLICPFYAFLYLFIKSALETTLTDENAIAAAAMAGFKSQPVKGYKTPAATGMPTIL